MALGVNIVSQFDSKGIRKALTDFKKLEGAGAKGTFALRTMDSAITKGITNFAKFGGIAAAGLGAVGFGLVKAAEAADTANARITQIATSMDIFGSGVGAVSERLQKLAESTALQIGLDANQIKATQAKLLTFKQLAVTADETGGAFDRATQAAIDLGAAGFGEATQNATQLGKALQDPIKGITALARSGVTFTDQEKEKIKALVQSGKMLEAQDTLLKAVESQVGGTAKATANSSDIMREQFRQLAADIGDRLQPTFEKLLGFVRDKLAPFVTNLLAVFDERGFAGVISMLSGKFLDFTSSGGKVKDILLALTTAVVTLKLVTIAATIAQNLFNVSLFANPIGIVVAAIIAFAVAVAAAYLRFEGFRKVVNFVINAVIGYFEFMVNMWIRAINLVIKGINMFGGILRAVGIDVPKLGEIGEVAFGRIGNAASNATKEVVGLQAETSRFLRLQQNAKPKPSGGDDDEEDSPVGGGVAKAVKTAKEKMKEYIAGLKDVQNAERSLFSSGKDIVKAREDLTKATQRVASAQAKFNQVTRGYGADSKEAIDAMRRVTDAAKRVRDANLSQQDSVRSLAAAEKKLADLRNLAADPADVASGERKLERSKYASEEAIFRVSEAEAELAALRLDPESSAVDIRRAEIALAEAKLSVTDSTIAQRDAENDLHKLRTLAASPEELAEAERELEKAKYAVQDATDAVRDATLEQSIAQAFYTQIIEGAKEGSEEYREALEDLLDAQEAERDASEKLTDQLYRERDATDALREAKEKLAALGTDVGGRVVSRATSRFAASIPAGATAPGGMMPIGATAAGNTSIVNNINAGMGADAAGIAQVIVDSLRDYERSNGFIPVTAQYAIAI